MLQKIVKIDRVGLFNKAVVQHAVQFKRATLIYADNGRGKSTLATLLRACSTGDAAPVLARATVQAERPPEVFFRFVSGQTGNNVEFDGERWNSTAPTVHVFDQTFVETNVFAGSEVHPDQQQALLDFALGASAVKAKASVDSHHAAQVQATKKRTAAEEKLKGYHAGATLRDFLELAPVADVEAQLAALDARIQNAREAKALNARKHLDALSLAPLKLGEFEQVLAATAVQMQEGARQLVQRHFNRHGGAAAEKWVGSGRSLAKHEQDCPFCGQETSGLALIEAYGSYFNREYEQHIARVERLAMAADAVLTEAAVMHWSEQARRNADVAVGWAPQLQLQAPELDAERLSEVSQRIRKMLADAAARKAAAPLTVVSLDVDALHQAWRELATDIATYNDAVAACNSSIETFKKALVSDDVQQLERELARLRLRKVRHSTEVKLTAFRGHLCSESEGVRDAQEQAAVRGGVQAADHRSVQGRSNAGRTGARVQAQRADRHGVGRA